MKTKVGILYCIGNVAWQQIRKCGRTQQTINKRVSNLQTSLLENCFVIYTTDTPHFQFIRPNIANNFDMNSPLGLSVYANHIDKFKALDTKYDSFTNEFELGKKRILVDRTALQSATQVDTNGNITNVSYFDRNDKAYVAINGMDGQPVKE